MSNMLMPEAWIIILIHQLVFQGMFVSKNIVLRRKIRKQIRGKNIEATVSIIYFSIIIFAALIIGFFRLPFGAMHLLNDFTAIIVGSALLVLSLVISGASLINLGDSWRVGVLEDQKTELITSGIYRFTRNPYFLSYLLLFAAYTVLLQNLILFGLSIAAIFFVHFMILKEEKYLLTEHADAFLQYKKKVPRYLII